MKNIPGLKTLILVLLTPSSALWGDSPSIIPEQAPGIQLISTGDFLDWPGTEGSRPLDVSAEDGRITLIWPQGLISLTSDGRTDTRTLLSLYTTAVLTVEGKRWSPEGGILCSDGLWRSIDSQSRTLDEWNLSSGAFTSSPWEGVIPSTLLPAEGGRLLIRDRTGGAAVVRTDAPAKTLPERLELTGSADLIQKASISRYDGTIAWQEAGSRLVHISGPDGLVGSVTAPSPLWDMDWMGQVLILAAPGELRAYSGFPDSPVLLETLNHRLIPSRWYRIRGGRDFLLVHSPESSDLAVIRPGGAASGRQAGSFASLLLYHALDAADRIETFGGDSAASDYYRWVLPLIRKQRSAEPLNEEWALLESRIADRRAKILGLD